MLLRYAVVSERLLVFIDNNVIQDILKHERENEPVRRTRFHALLALLMLAEDFYQFDIFACVSPAVFYEAAGRGSRGITETYQEVVDAIAGTGLAMHAVGFESLDVLPEIFERIRADESSIRGALDKIKRTSWRHDFAPTWGAGMRIPFSVAEESCPEVHLNYFSAWHVKFLLMHIIERRMFDENEQNKAARKLMLKPSERAFSILKSKGEGVEGLGDIELLTHCDLGNQTLRRSPSITMGVTFDRSLRDALLKRATVRSQMSARGGVDDPADSAFRFTHMLRSSQRRAEKSKQRMQEYDALLGDFFQWMGKHLLSTEKG